MAISFNLVPDNIRVPGAYIEIDNTGALRGLPGMPSRILVIGQRLASGEAPAAEPVRVLNAGQAEAYFGRGSMLARMFAALKANNSWTESWAIALDDDPAGNQAAGAVTFSGSVTAAGTVNLYIAGERVRAGAQAGATPAEVAAAMAAAINARTDLPVAAAVNGTDAAKVDITARHKGEAGNGIDIRLNYHAGERLPAGLGCTVTAMTGGTANPDIGGALAVTGDEWFTDISMPYTDAANLAEIEGELDRRYGPLGLVDGHAYAAHRASHANLSTLGNSRNSPHLTIMGNAGSPTWAPEWAAALCGVCAYHARIDPARPFQTLALSAVLPPPEQDRFTLEERNLLLHDGIATFRVDDGGLVRIERVITTYETNALGIDDPSYLDLNTMKTNAYLRYATRARILLKFPRHKLADDGTRFGAGQAIVTPGVIRAELIALFRQLEDAGLVEGLDQFKTDLIVERDKSDPNRINALIPPDIVNQFRVFAGQIKFLL